MIDQVVETREELAFIAGRLRARPLMLVVLSPPLAVARHRNATRPVEARVDYDFAPLARNQQRELGDLGWWLDSGEMTAAETADLIVAEAAKRAVITEGRLRAYATRSDQWLAHCRRFGEQACDGAHATADHPLVGGEVRGVRRAGL